MNEGFLYSIFESFPKELADISTLAAYSDWLQENNEIDFGSFIVVLIGQTKKRYGIGKVKSLIFDR